jgi:hypothetical protein
MAGTALFGSLFMLGTAAAAGGWLILLVLYVFRRYYWALLAHIGVPSIVLVLVAVNIVAPETLGLPANARSNWMLMESHYLSTAGPVFRLANIMGVVFQLLALGGDLEGRRDSAT